MSFRRAMRSDGNQSQIVAALRATGATVIVLNGESVDIICGFQGRTELMEIKDPASGRGRQDLRNPRSRTAQRQKRLREEWQGRPIRVITSELEALKVIGAI